MTPSLNKNMITTRKIELTPKMLFSFWLKEYKMGLIFSSFIVFMVANAVLFLLIEDYRRFFAMYLGFSIFWTVVFLVIQLVYAKYFYSSRENKLFVMERHYEFEDDLIKAFMQDGSMSTFRWQDVLKVVNLTDCYAFKLSVRSTLYVPFECFSTTKDREKFEEMLKTKKLI
jgi:hypothetical protein